MDYDSANRRLTIGKGYVENVTPEMWKYEVSGKQVLWQWFSYRRRDRSRPIIGDRRPPSPLDAIQPEGWLAEYTSDLLDLLHVLGRLVALEPAQTDLLNRICESPLLLAADDLQKAGALASPENTGAVSTRKRSKTKSNARRKGGTKARSASKRASRARR
jgi:Type ISP C-terminal specificity domain